MQGRPDGTDTDDGTTVALRFMRGMCMCIERSMCLSMLLCAMKERAAHEPCGNPQHIQHTMSLASVSMKKWDSNYKSVF